jgi:hypothetical protein
MSTNNRQHCSPSSYNYSQISYCGDYQKAENNLVVSSICHPDETVHPYARQKAYSLFNISLGLYHPSGGVDFDGISRESVQALTFQIDTGFLVRCREHQQRFRKLPIISWTQYHKSLFFHSNPISEYR